MIMMWTRRYRASHLIAFLASSATTARPLPPASSSAAAAAAFFSSPAFCHGRPRPPRPPTSHRRSAPSPPAPVVPRGASDLARRRMMSFGGPDEAVRRIDRGVMKGIVDGVTEAGREGSGYVVIDVRGHDEVRHTGKLGDAVETLPLPLIARGALAMDEGDFVDAFGFDKPRLDETIVFTCKAGIRSQQAGQLARMAGYSNILDYMGGSDEWFS